MTHQFSWRNPAVNKNFIELGILLVIVLFAMGAAFVALQRSAAASSASPSQPASSDWLRGIPSGKTRIIDLTYALNATTPAWPGDVEPFKATINASPEKDGYFTRKFAMLEHYSTHMDAPAHFPPGKLTIDQIPINRFFGPAVVLDVRAQAAKDENYPLSAAEIERWESAHGRIPEGAIVLLRTGWSSRWPDASRYLNMGGTSSMHFPGYSLEAARFLAGRKVSGLGTDTMSVDIGASKNYEVHGFALPAGLFQLENLADLSALPESGAFIIAAPIKLEGGSGGPCRVFAILPPKD
jgi:kynurenine formamidase